jgi:hypothetical protein
VWTSLPEAPSVPIVHRAQAAPYLNLALRVRGSIALLLRSSDIAVVISLYCNSDLMLGRKLAMRWIIQANIDKLKELLKTETDELKRAMETRLLAEEEAKLAKFAEPENEKKPA